MNLQDQAHRTISPSRDALHFSSVFFFPVLLILTMGQPATAQQSDAARVAVRAPLTAEQVVQNLVLMNLHRAQALQSFHGSRTYRVDYRGFPGNRSADMVVDVKYLSPQTKEFAIQSTTGSKLIIEKVFKKLLEAEKEALDAEMQQRSALTEDNYLFTLIGYQSTPAGSLYELRVEPRTKDKFLYRGRIWVDAEDFAVMRLEAEPAKNPSFWTKKAEIVQVYKKVGDFWLPASNRSLSTIRLGGHAELTIDYQDYEITAATSVSSLPVAKPSTEVGTARARD